MGFTSALRDLTAAVSTGTAAVQASSKALRAGKELLRIVRNQGISEGLHVADDMAPLIVQDEDLTGFLHSLREFSDAVQDAEPKEHFFDALRVAAEVTYHKSGTTGVDDLIVRCVMWLDSVKAPNSLINETITVLREVMEAQENGDENPPDISMDLPGPDDSMTDLDLLRCKKCGRVTAIEKGRKVLPCDCGGTKFDHES